MKMVLFEVSPIHALMGNTAFLGLETFQGSWTFVYSLMVQEAFHIHLCCLILGTTLEGVAMEGG